MISLMSCYLWSYDRLPCFTVFQIVVSIRYCSQFVERTYLFPAFVLTCIPQSYDFKWANDWFLSFFFCRREVI